MPKETELDHPQLRRTSQLMNDRTISALSWQSQKEAYAAHMANMHQGL